MARQARIVLPGFPHHVTQRGNRRQQTFFEDGDYALYRDLMATACTAHDVGCWAWCLMPNHVHLILEPARPESLANAVGEAHRRYTRHINTREGWTGFLWQGRFSSRAMDEGHALAAVRYVAKNRDTHHLSRSRPRSPAWSGAQSSAGFGFQSSEPCVRAHGEAGLREIAELRFLVRAEPIRRPGVRKTEGHVPTVRVPEKTAQPERWSPPSRTRTRGTCPSYEAPTYPHPENL